MPRSMWTIQELVDPYILVFLHLGTRHCWIPPCIVQTDSVLVSRQAVNFQMESEDVPLALRIVMRDNDRKLTLQFDTAM